MNSDLGEIHEIVEAMDLIIDIEIDLDPGFKELKKTTKRLQKADPLTLAKTIASFSIIGSIAGVPDTEMEASKNAYLEQWKDAVLPSASKNAQASVTTP